MNRILIIDDYPAARETLGAFLVGLGYEVLQAPDGPTGLDLLAREHPHLLFLDILMPGMNGLEVIKRIRGIDPTVPVVMVTGHDSAQIARELLLAGATDFIRKPLNLEYIQRVVEACLAKQPRPRLA
ncbi:MAG: response regulator [bacterium]|jgi:CheY-like chemotaxis protein|nr:response regulator [bacterium]